MKKITMSVFLMLLGLGMFSQNAPIDFETGGEGASWTWTVFENDDDPALAIVANPDPTGDNTSATVAEFTARDLGAPFAGVESMHGEDIGTFDLSSANAYVSIKVYKTKVSDVGIKFAVPSGGAQPEIKVANTLINQWETLTFDFTGYIGLPETTGLDQIIVFPDFVDRTADDVIYFDDITFSDTPPVGPLALPIDFEAGQTPVFGDFNGSTTQIVTNPATAGINASANVAQNTVPANAAFAGVNFPVGNNIDITTDKMFTMQVWSPLANTPVLLKLENATTGVNAEREVMMTSTSAWEEISFDFSTEGALTFESVTIFMNFAQTDANNQDYFWDNLEQVISGPPVVGLPIDFEAGQTPVFGDFNGSTTQIVTNPDTAGINASANVAQNTVPANAAFAGVNFPVGNNIDITTDKMFTMQVWSPLANTPVLLKLENATTGVNAEREVMMTSTSAWEEISFDFSTEGALTFESVTIFMNFAQTDANNQDYFWDNLEQVISGPPVVGLPIDFEAGQTPVFGDFNGSTTQIVTNPDTAGINASANVAQNTVPANAAFAGVNFPVGNNIDITTDKMFTMQVWSPLANTPVLLKLENATTGVNAEREVMMTSTSAWEEISFDFSTEGALTFESVTIFMNFAQTDANNQDYFWDNLEQVISGPPVVGLPIDFEAGQTPVFGDFNGSTTQIVTNPDTAGINASANVAQNTVPANAAFAGVNFPVGNNIDITTDKMFTMQVWSPLANTPVLLKLENATTGVNAEREVMMTSTSAWEEISFDFSTEGALTFESVTIFMNFAQTDANNQDYFWDNLMQQGSVAGPNAPINFEPDGEGADWTWTVFENDDNPPLAIVANPDPTGVNTSDTVAEFTARDLGQAFAGVESMHGADLGTFDLTADNAFITINVYKTKISDVGIKFATPSGGAQPEIKVPNTLINQWETLTFDFTSYIGLPETTGLDQIIIFPDFIDRTADDVIYFDDITFSDAPPTTPVALPVTFEDTTAAYIFEGFEGADSAIEANAVSGGINTSDTVMRTIKTVGSQFFAGTFVNLDVPADFSTTQTITMKTYSPKADIPVRMAIENQTTGNQIFVDVNTTMVDEWEVLSFDFSGVYDPAIDYNRVVVFFEFIVDLPGDGSTYYFDDIELFTAPTTPVELPVTFEDTTADYMFEGFEGADSAIEANAVSGGINTSDTVMRTIKTVGSQFFAGTFLNLDVPADFSTNQVLTMKTYSPKADIPVRMAIENQTTGNQVFVDVNTTMVDEWEVLTFDFSDVFDSAIDYDRVVVFFEFIVDLPGDGSTYYFDDIMAGEPLSVSEFELSTIVLYPNPVNDILNVRSASEISEIQIISITGQIAKQQSVNNLNAQIEIESLQTGVYFARVTLANGQQETLRIIKN